MQCIVDGRSVAYDRAGKGKTILVLHGWGSSRLSTRELAKFLQDKFDVINVDVPGFGESERPTTAWGLSEYAAWVQSFLEKIGVKRLYGLVGHSNGGAISIKLVASGFPVDRLVLLGASGIRSRDKGRKLFYKAVSKTGKVATAILPRKVKARAKKRWYKAIGSEYLDHPGMEESFKKVTKEDLVVEAAMISTPTLLVYGSDDRATPIVFGQTYHQIIDGSELMIAEGAGHYSFVDKPDIVNPRVKQFLCS